MIAVFLLATAAILPASEVIVEEKEPKVIVHEPESHVIVEEPFVEYRPYHHHHHHHDDVIVEEKIR